MEKSQNSELKSIADSKITINLDNNYKDIEQELCRLSENTDKAKGSQMH